MNGKDSDLTMEMLARGVTRAASGAAKDIEAEEESASIPIWGSGFAPIITKFKTWQVKSTFNLQAPYWLNEPNQPTSGAHLSTITVCSHNP